MSPIEFQPWPKIARLNRNIIITEKLDGTNAAVVIVALADIDHIQVENESPMLFAGDKQNEIARVIIPAATGDGDHQTFIVFAQSRNKFITPGKSTDNYGFAGWVRENAQALVATLGAGTHFGEWWGAGIQRGYGLTGGDKRFSLFNAGRWSSAFGDHSPIEGMSNDFGLGVVPVLYSGPFDQGWINTVLHELRTLGSCAVPHVAAAEGIVVYHTAARTSFKVTLEGDAAPAKVGPRNPLDLLPTEAIGLAA
jgi:hypothetical protein